MAGKGDQLKGKAKKLAGNLTDNERLEAEGHLQELGGKAKEKAEHFAKTKKEDV